MTDHIRRWSWLVPVALLAAACGTTESTTLRGEVIEACDDARALVIFDERETNFRSPSYIDHDNCAFTQPVGCWLASEREVCEGEFCALCLDGECLAGAPSRSCWEADAGD